MCLRYRFESEKRKEFVGERVTDDLMGRHLKVRRKKFRKINLRKRSSFNFLGINLMSRMEVG